MTQNNGKRFEQSFAKSCTKRGILFERYKDNGKFGFSDKTRFSSHNPCDGHIFYKQNLFYVELKTTRQSSISFERIKSTQQRMIKAHQIKSLHDRNVYDHVYGCLILNFEPRNTKTTYFEGSCWLINVDDFIKWIDTTERLSINEDECSKIGIQIEREVLKVNFDYEIKNALDTMIKNTKTILDNDLF